MRALLLTACVFALISCSSQEQKQQVAADTDSVTVLPEPRVTGIGGVFFKAKNPQEMRDWYEKHLGMPMNEYGAMFEFRDLDQPERRGLLQWSPFSENTKYFDPSESDLMINYRVSNLVALLDTLRDEGVQVLDTIETYEYGKFAHILDLEGNKVELWEPVDSVFTELYQGTTVH